MSSHQRSWRLWGLAAASALLVGAGAVAVDLAGVASASGQRHAHRLRFSIDVSAVSAPRAAGAVAADPPACTAGTDVNTGSGPVCGTTASGVTSYLGIPFGAPTTGALRWAAPQPAAPWTTTLAATAPGNQCPQPSFTGGVAGSEDCLNLNVQMPAGTTAGSRLPVMVEIHGGGFLLFGPPDGSYLVSTGHVVYVAMNYRLGIMGFLAEQALGAHSGDYGLQDQQAALRWVKQNIASFGGDPSNVTIFGQSAGGASVCDQTVSPTARGLFEKGIPESGFYNSAVGANLVWAYADCKSQLPTEQQAQAAGAALAAKVGCGSATDVAACLRALPVATLVENAGQVLNPTGGGTIAPTINGTTLPESPGKAFADGRSVNHVTLMNGIDRDELNGGVSAPPVDASTPAQYHTLLQSKYGPRLGSQVEALYPVSRFPSTYIAWRTVNADADSVCPSLTTDRNIARHIPLYAYQGADADNPLAGFLDPTVANGSFHDAMNEFLFPAAGMQLDGDQQALAQQVTAEWIGFAASSNPTVNGTPLWTRFTHQSPQTMSLVEAGDSALVSTQTIASQHHCDFWNSVTPQAHQ
jgi:para-nitrobenzyl esterase